MNIKEIQKALGVVADGIKGPKTVAAIKKFQKDHGLVVDGIVGPKTLSFLQDINTVERKEAETPPITGKILWPTQAQCSSFYGPPGQVKLQSIQLPYPFYYGGKLMKSTSVHEKIAPTVKKILQKVKDHYGVEKIDELKLSDYSGCYNPRRMRGGSAWSMHAYACALDFNAADNQLKWNHTKARFAKPIYNRWWELWEEEGAVSLGRVADYDWMHVQFARLR
jgi:hypothetical protein